MVVDDLSRGHAHNVSGMPFRQLNLSDTSALTDLLAQENADAVIHFAAYIAVGESTKNPELYFSNNVGGTISLLVPERTYTAPRSSGCARNGASAWTWTRKVRPNLLKSFT